jgi:DNA-binding response OmpR family regulator
MKSANMERILIIDDDVELCTLVGEYLHAEGFTVEAVHDGENGLQRASGGGYLLVVLDVMLPGINGFEVLRRIRATSRLPVLLLTARGEDVDRERSCGARAATSRRLRRRILSALVKLSSIRLRAVCAAMASRLISLQWNLICWKCCCAKPGA